VKKFVDLEANSEPVMTLHGSMFFRSVSKQKCDGQMDRQNYDPQDSTSIAASRSKNHRSFGYVICLYVHCLIMISTRNSS